MEAVVTCVLATPDAQAHLHPAPPETAMSVTWATLGPNRRHHWPISEDHAVCSPPDPGLRPSRSGGAKKSGRPASAVAALCALALFGALVGALGGSPWCIPRWQ